jgi:phage terminase large subunit-like protein
MKSASPLPSPVDAIALREGCAFDGRAADRVCLFFEKFLKHSKGVFAGKPFVLQPWQRDLLRRLYGWKRPDGTRRFRRAYIEVPKKQGKSTCVSGLLLYHLVADDEPGAEVYVGACDRAQASICFNEARAMVDASGPLSRILDVIPSQKRIVYAAKHAFLQALSADVRTKEGLNASFTCIDELHAQPTRELFDTLKYAGAARRQPLLLTITTAGFDRQSVCYKEREYALKVDSGLVGDTSHFAYIRAAEPTDDINDPATWHKANPSLGVTISEEDFAREVNEALESPEKLNTFLRYRLDLWTQAESRFLARDKWDACAAPPVTPKGAACYGGLDLSSTTDLSALALLFPDGDGGFDLLMRFWAPEEGAEIRERKDRVPYLAWARQGFLSLTPGNVIDYSFIRAELVALAARHDLKKLLIDPYNATQLAGELKEEDGLAVEFLRQGFLSLSAPTKELERLVLSGRLRHGGNPVLDWMCDNAMAVRDSAGNVKLSKEKSREKIDGMAALVNAVAAALDDPDGGTSVYETRGLITL